LDFYWNKDVIQNLICEHALECEVLHNRKDYKKANDNPKLTVISSFYQKEGRKSKKATYPLFLMKIMLGELEKELEFIEG